MSVDVVMPQMGESITEGTITKWLKNIGDAIERDEPLFEISTDKVDAEIPAPNAGILLAINHQEGETVEVGKIVAVIGETGEQPAATPSQPVQVEEIKPVVAEVKQPEPPEPVAIQPPVVVENTPNPPSEIRNPQSANGATEVVMPQMGESITEGTITKWLKQVGDAVERDEQLFEISTDKVDAEIPSPIAGILLAINNQEGETVEVGKVVALIGAAGASVSTAASPNGASAQKQAVETTAQATSADVSAKVEPPKVETVSQVQPVVSDSASNADKTVEELRKTKSSPLVRNIAKEHGVDISKVHGSGMSGRVTKTDILSFIDSGANFKPTDLLVKPLVSTPSAVPTATPIQTLPMVSTQQITAPVLPPGVGDKVVPMSVMRKKIAEKMVISKQTSAHVTSVYEIDMSGVVKFRNQNKDAFQARYGTKLTFMPFIFQAVTDALRNYPIINSQVSGDQIIYKGDINLGMAVALDWGLIVPVIKNADQLSMAGLATTANDLAERARTKKLNPDEVQGGTFTITNTGTFGGLFGVPIINQPQVAIMCFGTIEKRPKVITTPDGDDVIVVRSMAYFALTYDHRIIDGADAEKFLAHVKRYLETSQFNV
jgi:pyruvate dehydrogenase E2 component (dihydrolipoamide acetyltransferase)